MTKEERLEILLKGIKEDLKEQKCLDEEDGIDVNNPQYVPESFIVEQILYMQSYKAIRTEEAWYSKNANDWGCDLRTIRTKLTEYDHSRRQRHDLALSSVNVINRMLERYNLPRIYEGEVLTDEEISAHKDLDKIKAYTDFFLDLLNDIEYLSIRNLESLQTSKENDAYDPIQGIDELRKLSREFSKFSYKYGVKQTLLEEDGDILFYD